MAIRQFLNEAAFEPDDVQIMSTAFEDICRALEIPRGAGREREVIAMRVIELTRRGERDPDRLRDRILREAGRPDLKSA